MTRSPSTSTGALAPGKTTGGTVINTGANIAIITYDLQLLPTVLPADVIPNTATLTNYASTEGGPNFLPPAGISDKTTVTVVSPPERIATGLPPRLAISMACRA